MSHNFTYPENSSSMVVTIIVGVVISILTFILLYNSTDPNFSRAEQDVASIYEDDDLGCEVEEVTPTTVQQPPVSTSSTSSQQQQTTAAQQQQTATAQQQQQPAATQQQTSSSTAPAKQTYSYDDVDSKPMFPGGQSNLNNWLNNNIMYPAQALEVGVEGQVLVQFTVFKDGSVGDIRVTKSVHPALDNEAKRLVKAMPNWTPGKVNGQPVNVTYTLPISFRM